ncbi:MFS transporter [Nocardia flavorosea]|uniref:MDR family MFS transporter n=1 Tax=Nocardia flavorosea TaxID=53429 RepID=UPI0018938A6A|nr:MDR family MFS transporter [Nocardia flavorosea]MBF6352788.1 MFS transporter [Nocardia flavorosea]
MTGAREVPATAPTLDRRRRNIVFVTIVLGMLMAALDQTIVATTLPTIVADLGSAGHMAWLVTAYMLAEAITTVLAGKFGDLFGRKLVFQISAVVFILGSILAGVAQDMLTLIVARGIQGVGAGGLMVTAMALIADVIPLRQRGKYQGAMGAVFGVTTVLGPTLGGLFTDHASWRWCFYINVPVAVVMIVLAARVIPTVRPAVRPVIDYLGIALVALGVAGLILGLEWGGSEYPWGSPTIIGLFAGSVVLLAAFVVVETRVPEPMLPMDLFRNRVFTVCSILSFIVGFAMLGAMTYLPTYLQYVDGVSATESGLRTLPMVVGLLITSIISGNIVSTTGRYKPFPIAGTAVMALGLYLMSTMGRDTGIWLESLYMLVLGLGIGLSMQVLTIVVQNTVPYAQLGTATSGVTFFRTVGSAFGTAVFGTLYTGKLDPALAAALAESGVAPEIAQSPAALRELPDDLAAPIIEAYTTAIDTVFRWVVPVALVGFVVAWFLREVPLRDSTRARAAELGEGFSMPDSADRAAQLERAVAQVLRWDQGRYPGSRELRDHGSPGQPHPGSSWRRTSGSPGARKPVLPGPSLHDLTGGELPESITWAIGAVHLRARVRGGATLTGIADDHMVPVGVLEPVYRDTARAGYVTADGDSLRLTGSGTQQAERFRRVWRGWLDKHLEDWTFDDPADKALLDGALDKIAGELLDDQSRRPTFAG